MWYFSWFCRRNLKLTTLGIGHRFLESDRQKKLQLSGILIHFRKRMLGLWRNEWSRPGPDQRPRAQLRLLGQFPAPLVQDQWRRRHSHAREVRRRATLRHGEPRVATDPPPHPNRGDSASQDLLQQTRQRLLLPQLPGTCAKLRQLLRLQDEGARTLLLPPLRERCVKLLRTKRFSAVRSPGSILSQRLLRKMTNSVFHSSLLRVR